MLNTHLLKETHFNVVASLDYDVSLSLSWLNSKCNTETKVTKIRGFSKNIPYFKEVNVLNGPK